MRALTEELSTSDRLHTSLSSLLIDVGRRGQFTVGGTISWVGGPELYETLAEYKSACKMASKRHSLWLLIFGCEFFNGGNTLQNREQAASKFLPYLPLMMDCGLQVQAPKLTRVFCHSNRN